MEKQKILFVSHCLLNISSKVVMWDFEDMAAEEALRQRFLTAAIPAGIQLVQLPCPEFTLYGARRWGHVSDQFDNVFFRNHCRAQLSPILDQLEEYLATPERYEVLGFCGIDGSPSCGVDYTCVSREYYGSISGRPDAEKALSSCELAKKPGVMYTVLKEMLAERGIDVPVRSLCAWEPDKIMSFLEK